MKAMLLSTVSLLVTISSGVSQGVVGFYNSVITLISAGPVGQQAAISGPAGSYFFALLLAPPGTTDPIQFTFSGVYATNMPYSPGRLFGGVVAVPGWAPGNLKSFFVAGWSASLGPVWNDAWLRGDFGTAGDFGHSSIATMVIGNGMETASNLFGGVSGIQTGFNLNPVPEPKTAILAGLGALMLMIYWRIVKSGFERVRP